MTTQDGELHASFGVMGIYMQPQGHFQMLVNLLDLGMTPQQALDMPRWALAGPGSGLGAGQPGGLVRVEEGWSFATLAELARRGHRLAPVDGFGRGIFGGGQIILRDPDTGVLTAGSDPRKDGCAAGFWEHSQGFPIVGARRETEDNNRKDKSPVQRSERW